MLSAILSLGNLILASANVIIGFSLFIYILTHNLRSSVAHAFCALMAFVTAVYVGDIGITEAQTLRAANAWLRFQWIGIAFVPAAYFHFSDALLRTTGDISRWRRAGIASTYSLGLIAFVLAAISELIVDGVTLKEHIYHLRAGPLFWLFAVYYLITTLSGWVNITRARSRCLTTTSRRRMSYLMLAFIAPSLGAFPYLLIPATAHYLSAGFVTLLALLGNIGIALMTVVIGYIVAYQGVLLPDRVIKHNLLHFLLRGPLVAIIVVALMLTIPRVEHVLGLPRDTVLVVTVAGSVVILQVLINLAKPAIDRLVYGRDPQRDRVELAWIQTLDQRLLTTADLEQLLENTLIALCDLLRAPSGFVVTMQGSSLAVRVFCGPAKAAHDFLARASLSEILDAISQSRRDEFVSNEDLILMDGHWLLPLRSRSDGTTLGILGIRATSPEPSFGDAELETLYGLVRRAEFALEDMRLQQQIFAVLQGLRTELDQVQAWRSTGVYATEQALQGIEMNPIHAPGFVQMVRDALNQFWGGPKLNQSPLMRLTIVRERLEANDQIPAKAIRSVLRDAIERLRPDTERSMIANEWLVYNILDLKFLQGHKIRDITQRLAMSDSDFYRKQRIAIEQVAYTLAQMERARAADRQRTHPLEDSMAETSGSGPRPQRDTTGSKNEGASAETARETP